MFPLEIVVGREVLRVTERAQPDGRPSHDFAWITGPADGTYGFTLGVSGSTDGETRMTRERLVTEARLFVESYHAEHPPR